MLHSAYVGSSFGEGKELFDLIKSKIEIPDNLKKLTITFEVDELVKIDATFFAQLKENNE